MARQSSLSSDWGDSDDPDLSDSSNVDFSGGATGSTLLDLTKVLRRLDITKVPNGSIYYFHCQGPYYKVGMTKRDIKKRLKEHMRNPDEALRPRPSEMIKVLLCDNVLEAERSIRHDKDTPAPEHGREYFRTDIWGVIDRVVAAVNSRPNRIKYYDLNPEIKFKIKSVRVPM